MLEDFNWFVENYDRLYGEYGCKYLAIKNKTVIGAYDDVRTAIDTTEKTEEPGTFIVQKCDGTQDAYTNYIASWSVA